MSLKPFLRRTVNSIMKGILGQNDVKECIDDVFTYIALTPWYMKIGFLGSIFYLHLTSLLLCRKVVYRLSGKDMELLLSRLEVTIIGSAIVMMFKLLSTLTYFHYDHHARLIGYEHLHHCR